MSDNGAELPVPVKEGPHWRVVFRPLPFVEERLELQELLSVVDRARVRLRGWDFPHQNPHERPEIGRNWVASWDTFMGHVEYWRMYQSGQFVYLSGVRETTETPWSEKLRRLSASRIVPPTPDFDWSQVPGFLELVNFVYTVTEFFEFAARLAQELPETETCELTVGLHGVEGFVLAVDDIRRAWWEYYAATQPVIENTWSYPVLDWVSRSHELSLEAIRWIVVRFGWMEPNVEAIKRDQETLLRRG
jgi:hypothetical protein